MKILFAVAFAMVLLCPFCHGANSLACPRLVEIFPDPVDTVDAAGEFIEIRLAPLLNDTLFLRMESKAEAAFEAPHGRRLLLHRDSLACPKDSAVDCRPLTLDAIPNSREMLWVLRQGECLDSVLLPVPKAGKTLQWNDFSTTWEHSTPTPGRPNPEFESGIDDCGITLSHYIYKKGFYEVGVLLNGCDSARVHYNSESMDLSARTIVDSLLVRQAGVLKIPSNGTPERLLAYVKPDEVPQNDSIETLLVAKEKPPLLFTEIHYCPEEGGNEWVELYNALPRALPVAGFSFCERGTFASGADSILPYESVLFTKDSAALRSEIGFADARIFKASFGTLKNAGDTIALCHGSDTLAVVSWGKDVQGVCPAGFNPQNGNRENTPGFQSRNAIMEGAGDVPFKVELSGRATSLCRRTPIRARITGTAGKVKAVLLSENGHSLREWGASTMDNLWFEIPILDYKPGVYFFKCIWGRYEKTFGLVLRP